MNRFANVLPLMHFLQIVLDIDTFNPKSYPGTDAFIAQSYMIDTFAAKKLHSN